MNEAHLIVVEPEGSPVAAEVDARLSAWNEDQIGPCRRRMLTLSVRNSGGGLIGGLTGEVHWNVLYIENLWVEEEYRGRGIGSALLARAEAAAHEHQCEVVFLSTFTFQAPRFYERCGYTRFGELPYGSRDFNRLWFAKRLVGARPPEAPVPR